MSAGREALLKQITILDFMAVDLQLYLNTHPTDKDALEMYNDCIDNARAAKKVYEQQFGPLTGFRSDAPDGWTWSDEPWPWQAEFNFSMTDKTEGA